MSDEELRQKTLAALAAVPGAVGVNNHMGSELSADEPSMETVLRVLAGRRRGAIIAPLIGPRLRRPYPSAQ